MAEVEQEWRIQQILDAIKSRQFRSDLHQTNALLAEPPLVSYHVGLCNRMNHIFAWWSDVPLFSSLLYALCTVFSLKTCFLESQGSWIQVSSQLMYYDYMLYLCCKLERYIGTLRFIWAFVIWMSISLMFSMISKGTIDCSFSGVCFALLTVDAVVRRSRYRVMLGYIKAQTELYPLVVMLVCHFMAIGSLPCHICGVITGYAYAYGLFDMLQPGYVFLSRWETRLYWNLHPVVRLGRYRKFVSCTTCRHTSDVLAHIPISYILQVNAHSVFQQALLDAEDLEPKIEAMVHAEFSRGDATFILQHCIGDLDAAFDVALTLEDILRKIHPSRRDIRLKIHPSWPTIYFDIFKRRNMFKYLRHSCDLYRIGHAHYHIEYVQRIIDADHEQNLGRLNRWMESLESLSLSEQWDRYLIDSDSE